MSDNKCQHPGCEARKVGSRVYCVEHCLANLEERLQFVEKDLAIDVRPWKPRTMMQIVDAAQTEPHDWARIGAQSRTDDIARMIEEDAQVEQSVIHAQWMREMAERIRALE